MFVQDLRALLFTKEWKCPIPELGEIVAGLGFDGVELPVRPGFQVTPDNALTALPAAAKDLERQGLAIGVVAGDPTDDVIAACGDTGVPTIRICSLIRNGTYLECEDRLRREYEALVPKLEKHNVVLGIQNHWNRCVPNALAVRRLIEPIGSDRIRLVWDPAHETLQGQNLDLAAGVGIDILQHVNLKNAVWQRTNPDTDAPAEWRTHWVLGRDGLASWPLALGELKRLGYTGDLVFCAEYSDLSQLEDYVARDLEFAKSILETKA